MLRKDGRRPPRSPLRARQRRAWLWTPSTRDPACPEDKARAHFEDELVANRLKRRTPLRRDIPIMLIDEAETVDDAEHDRLVTKAEAEGIKPTFEA